MLNTLIILSAMSTIFLKVLMNFLQFLITYSQTTFRNFSENNVKTDTIANNIVYYIRIYLIKPFRR